MICCGFPLFFDGKTARKLFNAAGGSPGNGNTIVNGRLPPLNLVRKGRVFFGTRSPFFQVREAFVFQPP